MTDQERMNHHPSCKTTDTGLFWKCEQCGDETRAGEYEKRFEELEAQVAILRAALEKLNFTDERIIEFINKVPSESRVAILKVVGEIADKALSSFKLLDTPAK